MAQRRNSERTRGQRETERACLPVYCLMWCMSTMCPMKYQFPALNEKRMKNSADGTLIWASPRIGSSCQLRFFNQGLTTSISRAYGLPLPWWRMSRFPCLGSSFCFATGDSQQTTTKELLAKDTHKTVEAHFCHIKKKKKIIIMR